MNRTIKFRFWDGHRMSEVRKLGFLPTGLYHVETEPQTYSAGESIGGAFILMQFTGLLDKNGVEIYEGDVLSMDSWEPKNVQVTFIEGAFCLANEAGEYVGDIHYIHHADRQQATVIGNIWENPELLK